MSTFDLTAPNFDRYRAFPANVPAEIRSSLCALLQTRDGARVLDLGAGTGRIGKVWVATGESYIGVDLSLAMLREFLARSPRMNGRIPDLIQADGEHLPFRSGAFDLVLLMQVLGGARDWQVLLPEARRVTRPGGALAVGHSLIPELGLDARLKTRLSAIFREINVDWASEEWDRKQKAREQALSWLESSAKRRDHVVAATWKAARTAREFLLRHRTGARFAALPPPIQEEALQRLSAWAQAQFGSLDAVFHEDHSFEIDIFQF